ncbi:MAG TPA: DUF72 domain-containing protein [Polyangiaceae bacterium]|jgi:uncharacterized protein YecE (DUF72 family)|nr:DUF72 domain-containing protein [Polyangiaceae bacterium]
MNVENRAQVFVGESALHGNIQRYAERFDMVEVSGDPAKHPRRAVLTAWRRTAREDFAFSVVVPSSLAALDAGTATDELVTHAESVASALSATWWVLRTPATVTPNPRALRGLEALIGRLRTDERRIAWEPRGVWGDEESSRAAKSLGVHLVRDLSRQERVDDDDVVYCRLRALGEGTRIGAGAAERVAERLESASAAYVVVEGSGAATVRRVLREMAGSALGHDEDESDDDELDENEEESIEDDGEDSE